MTAKILFYTHGLVDGGAERLWSTLASAIKARGYDVTFVQDFEAQENKANLDPAIKVHTLGRNPIRAVRNLAGILQSERPNVVLSAVGGSNTKLIIAKWLARVPFKSVITYHGYNEWKTGLLSLISYLGLPLFSKAADAIVAVSDGLRNDLITTWRADPVKTITILNPVFFPKDAAVPTASELQARGDIVLSVGRFVPEKDFVTLIRAFALIRKQSARLVIIGRGPEEPKMRSEIARLGLTDRVSLPGYITEPWTFYQSAKCLVCSSTSEAFGNVLVEAMAYGIPVVSTASPGPQEILAHGQHGRMVPVGDVKQLALAIEATLENPGDPSERRKRADDFSFDARVPAYEALIIKLLDRPTESACAKEIDRQADHQHPMSAA